MRTKQRSAANLAGRLALSGVLCAGAVRAAWPWTTTALSSPPLPAGRYVQSATVSPDGRVAVYTVLESGTGPIELRCSSLDAEAGAFSLTAPLSDAFQFGEVVFSPDSRRIAFVAYVPTVAGWVSEVWSVEVCRSGAVPVRLVPDGTPVADASTSGLRFAPGGQRVLYRSDWQVENEPRLYSAPAAGGAAVDLSGGAGAGGDFEPTLDGQHVLFGKRSPAGFMDLVRIPIAGPASAATVLVHGEFQDAATPNLIGIASGSGRIVYLAEDDLPPFGQWQLYSTPLVPPADRQIRLNPTLTLDGTVVDAMLSPDGTRVAYVADQAEANVYELYSVPVAGPSTSYVKLNGPLPDGSAGVVRSEGRRPFFLPDSSRVVYFAAQDDAIRIDLYGVPAAGPASTGARLNVNTPDGQYWGATSSPDSSLVVFTGPETQVGTSDLHLRRADGTGPELDLFCDAPEPWWGSDGVFAFCLLSLTAERQLYHWRLSDSPGWSRTDVTPLDDGDPGSMGLFGISARTGGVLFTYDRPTEGIFELFTADRRIYWGGFESGSTAGWSVVVP